MPIRSPGWGSKRPGILKHPCVAPVGGPKRLGIPKHLCVAPFQPPWSPRAILQVARLQCMAPSGHRTIFSIQRQHALQQKVLQWLGRAGIGPGGVCFDFASNRRAGPRPARPPNSSLLLTGLGRPGPQTPHFYRQAWAGRAPKPLHFYRQAWAGPVPKPLTFIDGPGPVQPPTPHFYWPDPFTSIGQPLASIANPSLLLATPSLLLARPPHLY